MPLGKVRLTVYLLRWAIRPVIERNHRLVTTNENIDSIRPPVLPEIHGDKIQDGSRGSHIRWSIERNLRLSNHHNNPIKNLVKMTVNLKGPRLTD
jgi:hypothetical protein